VQNNVAALTDGQTIATAPAKAGPESTPGGMGQ